MKSVEACVNGILQEISKRKTVDYSNKASVRQFNAAYRKCLGYMKYIDMHYPDKLDVLMQLLLSTNVDVVAHCAPMVLRLSNTTEAQKQEAIRAIRGLLENSQISPLEKLGFSALLEKYDK